MRDTTSRTLIIQTRRGLSGENGPNIAVKSFRQMIDGPSQSAILQINIQSWLPHAASQKYICIQKVTWIKARCSMRALLRFCCQWVL